jgi:hypothetical protein
MFERASPKSKVQEFSAEKWISLFVFAKVNLGAAKDLQNRPTAINNSSKRSSFGFHPQDKPSGSALRMTIMDSI